MPCLPSPRPSALQSPAPSMSNCHNLLGRAHSHAPKKGGGLRDKRCILTIIFFGRSLQLLVPSWPLLFFTDPAKDSASLCFHGEGPFHTVSRCDVTSAPPTNPRHRTLNPSTPGGRFMLKNHIHTLTSAHKHHKHTITHASPYSTPSNIRTVGFQSIEFPARGAEGGHRRRQHPNEAGPFRSARHQSSICGRHFEPHGEANVTVHCSTIPRLSQRLLGNILYCSVADVNLRRRTM